MACQMIQDGVTSSGATSYPPKFASVYRRGDLCSKASKQKTAIDPIIKRYETELQTIIRSGKEAISLTTFVANNPSICAPRGGAKSDKDKSVCSTENSLNRALAFKMYFEQQACPTGIGSQLNDSFRAYSASPTSAFDYSNEFNCQNIPQSNCDAAKAVLETFKVDFEWTMEQHNAGARFAAEKCKPKAATRPTTQCEIPDAFFADYYEKLDDSSPASPASNPAVVK